MSIFASCNLFQSCSSCKPSVTPITFGINSNSYTIQPNDYSERGTCERKIDFKHSNYNIDDIEKKYQWIKITSYSLEKNANENVVVLHIENTSIEAVNKRHKIIYCQNERSDLGISLPFLIDLGTQLKSDIISFDYSGYGNSKGKGSLDNMLEDVHQVLNFAIVSLSCPINELFIFGESIGALCALYMSMLTGYTNLRGIILLSPSFSGKETTKFSSHSYGEITCPVLIIQGKKDTNMSQCSELIKKLQFQYHWFPKTASDIEVLSLYRHKFYIKIRNYIQLVVECGENLSPGSFDEEDQFSINANLKTKKIKLIGNYIVNSKSTSNGGFIQSNIDKNDGKSCGIYVIESTTPDNKPKKGTLQNNLPSINHKNMMYKTADGRTESNGTFDLFS